MTLVNRTIFGEQQGKWMLGTDVRGREAALSGKWVGEALQTPRRVTLETSPLAWMVLGAVVSYVLTRPEKGLLDRLFG